MGLDMYLTKKTYIGANYPHNEVQGSVSIRTKEGPVNVKLNRITEIIEEVGYWRKANAIHGWFVENVQGGEDDCRAYEVELSQLLELKAIILKIQNEKGKKRESLATELLPPRDGFFFGSEKIDDGYWQDLQDTLDIIARVEAEAAESDKHGGWVSWRYQASW